MTLAASVTRETKALFDALHLMMRQPSMNEASIRSLIGIGQNMSEQWTAHFSEEAERARVALVPVEAQE